MQEQYRRAPLSHTLCVQLVVRKKVLHKILLEHGASLRSELAATLGRLLGLEPQDSAAPRDSLTIFKFVEPPADSTDFWRRLAAAACIVRYAAKWAAARRPPSAGSGGAPRGAASPSLMLFGIEGEEGTGSNNGEDRSGAGGAVGPDADAYGRSRNISIQTSLNMANPDHAALFESYTSVGADAAGKLGGGSSGGTGSGLMLGAGSNAGASKDVEQQALSAKAAQAALRKVGSQKVRVLGAAEPWQAAV